MMRSNLRLPAARFCGRTKPNCTIVELRESLPISRVYCRWGVVIFLRAPVCSTSSLPPTRHA